MTAKKVWKFTNISRSKASNEPIKRPSKLWKSNYRCYFALHDSNVGFRPTSGGKLIFHVFGALAEFERDLVQERTRAGLAAARARGKKGGRRKVMDAKKVAIAVSLLQNPDTSVMEVCRTLRVSRATLYRYLSPHTPLVSHTLSSRNEDAPAKSKKTSPLSKH